MNLLFVCSGNTCRSPLALAAWQRLLARELDEDCRARLAKIKVSSAGLNARSGASVSPLAARVASEWDVDLSAHRARNWQNAQRADLIVAMTNEQSAQIRFRLGAARGHVEMKTLGEFVPATMASADVEVPPSETAWQGDIYDPYGGSLEAYQECGARILCGVRALARWLCRAQ